LGRCFSPGNPPVPAQPVSSRSGTVHRGEVSTDVGGDQESENMASVCEICGKGPSWGMSVSHSHRRTKRRWNPNIQRVRAVHNGGTKRINVCTSCIRAGKIVKAG